MGLGYASRPRFELHNVLHVRKYPVQLSARQLILVDLVRVCRKHQHESAVPQPLTGLHVVLTGTQARRGEGVSKIVEPDGSQTQRLARVASSARADFLVWIG